MLAAQVVVVVVVEVTVPVVPLRLVAEGAGLNEEEAELTGEGSMEEAESMQRAESRELIDPSRFPVFGVVDCCAWAFIQGCFRHTSAVSRLLEGGREGGGREKLIPNVYHNPHTHTTKILVSSRHIQKWYEFWALVIE